MNSTNESNGDRGRRWYRNPWVMTLLWAAVIAFALWPFPVW
jgi:hypothetical protein